MRKLSSILALLFILSSFLQAQENSSSAVQNYKNAKIKLVSGEIIKCKNLTINSSNVDFATGTPALNKSMQLDKIEEIYTPTKSNTGFGLLIGAAVGGVTMLIVEKIFEEPKTTSESGYGWSSTTTTTKIMAPGPKIAIVAGGAAVGALIGSTIKSGWKKIYPSKSDNFSFNINSSPNYAMLNLQFKF